MSLSLCHCLSLGTIHLSLHRDWLSVCVLRCHSQSECVCCRLSLSLSLFSGARESFSVAMRTHTFINNEENWSSIEERRVDTLAKCKFWMTLSLSLAVLSQASVWKRSRIDWVKAKLISCHSILCHFSSFFRCNFLFLFLFNSKFDRKEALFKSSCTRLTLLLSPLSSFSCDSIFFKSNTFLLRTPTLNSTQLTLSFN